MEIRPDGSTVNAGKKSAHTLLPNCTDSDQSSLYWLTVSTIRVVK